MDLGELNNLTLDDIGEWPSWLKGLLTLLLCVLVVAGGYFYHIEDLKWDLDQAKKEEAALRQEFKDKQDKAVNLEAYREQLKEIKESFGAMLRQLPDKTEVASLLVDVSQTGLAAGLEFELFQPEPEVKRDFYAELPIKIRVVGTYHQFGEFVSGLATLPRIVTVHDVRIHRSRGGDKLVMEMTAKTYRYLEE